MLPFRVFFWKTQCFHQHWLDHDYRASHTCHRVILHASTRLPYMDSMRLADIPILPDFLRYRGWPLLTSERVTDDLDASLSINPLAIGSQPSHMDLDSTLVTRIVKRRNRTRSLCSVKLDKAWGADTDSGMSSHCASAFKYIANACPVGKKTHCWDPNGSAVC
jgi:hypothetical protein